MRWRCPYLSKRKTVMKRALCVGINDYPGTGSDLSGCVNDAGDWGEVFAEREFNVDTLLDSEATRAKILDKLRAAVSIANYGDLIVFAFSGHGSWIPDDSGDEPDGRDEVLCCHDIEQGNWLDDDTLAQIFGERERGVRIVFISDSCHSGTVSRVSRPSAPAPQAARVRFMPPSVFLKDAPLMDVRGIAVNRRAAPPPGRTASLLLAGCGDREFSYDSWFNGRANGAFSYAALRALERLPPTATYREWYRSIRTELPSGEYPQTPAIYGPRYQALRVALSEGP